VLEVALERFLGKSLKKGLVFCDFEMKSGTRVTELPGLLIPGTKYVSEDNRVELLLTSTDKRITFRFCPEAKILPAEQFKKTLYSASYISQIQIGSRKRMREHAPSYELMPFPPAPRSPEHFIDLGPMCPQSSSFGYEHPLASSPMTYGTARSAAFPTCFACQREGSAANHHRHRFLSDRDDHDDDSQPSKRQRVHDSDASSSSTSSTLVAADAIDEEGSAPPPPPPPMMLPPPPPPPPMLNRSKDQNAKRLRPLRWSSIPAHKLESTVWARKDVPSIPSTGSLISQHEVESLFSISPIKRSLDSVERTKAHSLIDIKRSNNIAITLTQFSHMSFDQIKDCLLLKSASSSSDTAPPKLTIDNLAALQMIFPITPEERRVLLIKAGVADTLPIAERFLIHFLDVMNPELKARVQLFMKTFDMQTAELAEDLDAILTACDQVQRTERLPQLLRIILVLGSVLNRDTYLNTCGFRLQSLRKLGETRTRRKGHTALNYLAKVAHDYNPAILSFADDLPQCVQASEIDLDDLAASVRALTAGMELVVSELEADLADSNNAGMPDSPYAEALRAFYARSNDTLSSLQQQLLQAQSTFAKVSEYFGEDSGADQIKSTDFFSILTEFSDSLLVRERCPLIVTTVIARSLPHSLVCVSLWLLFASFVRLRLCRLLIESISSSRSRSARRLPLLLPLPPSKRPSSRPKNKHNKSKSKSHSETTTPAASRRRTANVSISSTPPSSAALTALS